MIKTKKDLKNYIYLDRKANFISIKSLKDLINLYLFNDIAIFLLLLRKCEYYKSKSGLISKIIYFYYNQYIIRYSYIRFQNYFLPRLFYLEIVLI